MHDVKNMNILLLLLKQNFLKAKNIKASFYKLNNFLETIQIIETLPVHCSTYVDSLLQNLNVRKRFVI